MNTESALNGGGKVAVTINQAAETHVAEKEKKEEQALASIVTGEPVVSIKWHQLFRIADRFDWLLIVCGTIGGCGSGIMLPLFAILFGNFSNIFGQFFPPCDGPPPPGYLTPDQFNSEVSSIALQFVWLSLGAYVAGFLQQFCWTWVGNRMSNKLRRDYLLAVLRQETAFFDTQATTGGLLQGLNEDSIAVQSGISEKVGSFQQHATTFVVGYIVAFTKGWDITLVMVGCLPFLAGAAFFLAKMTTRLTETAQAAYTQAGAIVHQSVSQMRTVAAYNGEQRAKMEYAALLDTPAKVGKKQGLISGLSLGALQFVMFCSYSVALFYGAYRVAAGVYTGGTVLSVIIASLVGSFSLGLASPNIQHFVKASGAGSRMWVVINRKPKIDSEQDGVVPETVVGQLELRNVTFAYPARPDVTVFSDFSLTVPAGKTVALVGSSGSGKSTVVGLIERFYDPWSGTVLLDGVDIRTLKLSWLRAQVGLVSQEPTLFGTTIYENIAMGREGATRVEVEAAAKAANAYKFISALPLGLETKVGERGIALSGGQKQRIAIARAILKNPKILLLDEATSALDSESERIVQDALDRMIVGRTTVVVAHRLSTIKNADIISVVRAGVIVEQGTHEQLLKDPTGAYTTLVQLQIQRHQEEDETSDSVEIEEAEDEEVVEMLENGQAGGADGAMELASVGSSGQKGRPSSSLEMARTSSIGQRPASATSKRGSTDLRHVVVDGKDVDAVAADPDSIKAVKGKVTKRKGKAVKKDGDAAAEEEEKVKVPFTRLLSLNKPEWYYGVLGCVASAGVGAVQPIFALVISSMITVFYITNPDELKSEASKYSWFFFAVACGSMLSYACQQWSFGVMAQELSRRLRIMLFTTILKQDIGWFDHDANSSGRIGSVLSADATHVRGAVADVFGLVLQNLSTLAVGYIIAFIYDWRMALLVTGVLPLMALGALFNIRYNIQATDTTEGLYGDANTTVSEALSSMRIIHAYGLQARITKLYSGLLDVANRASRKAAVIAGLAFGFSMFMMFVMYSLVIWFGGLEVSSCRASFGSFLKAFVCILMAAMGLAQAQMSFPDLGKAQSAVQRVFRILDRKPVIDSSSPDGLQPDKAIRGELELQDIRFAYPTRPSVIVFNGFNLTMPAGKTVALVGESGSGKSTVVGLIERFYDPLSGTVMLDGVDIKQYNVQWLRKQIALVSQEPLLFTGTIGNNIRYGRPEASQEEMMEAARAANAHDFIMSLPGGYDTQVGERGVQLSGGQKQRVAIARAVVKDPKILLLDEATSALDAQAERVVQDALDRIMVGRTSVVVAHRLSTVRNADVIAVVFRGVLLEKGTHEELMAIPNGGYAKLVANQMKSKSTPDLTMQAAGRKA